MDKKDSILSVIWLQTDEVTYKGNKGFDQQPNFYRLYADRQLIANDESYTDVKLWKSEPTEYDRRFYVFSFFE